MPTNYKELGLGALGDVAAGVRELICGSGGALPDLGGLVPVIQQFIDSLQSTGEGTGGGQG